MEKELMEKELKIIEKIIGTANEERDVIINKANEEGNAVIRKAQELADREMMYAKIAAEAEAEKASAKEISGAMMEAKKRILAAKQECLVATQKATKETLLSLSGDEYVNVILTMLENAEKGEEVLFSTKDRAALVDAVSAKGYTVSEVTRDIQGGFIVKKGDIEYNYTFESIMAIQKEEIEKIAAEILFS